MPTISELVDQSGIPDRRQDRVKGVLHLLGFESEDLAGKAFLNITEKHMTDAGICVADAIAILAENSR